MARFQASPPNGVAVQELEVLVRASSIQIGQLELSDGCCRMLPTKLTLLTNLSLANIPRGEPASRLTACLAHFPLERDYYYHEGKKQGHCAADAALGLRALTRRPWRGSCVWRGPMKPATKKAEQHWPKPRHLRLGRQIQRMVQRVGAAAQQWQEREAKPGGTPVPIMYVSADGTVCPCARRDWQDGLANSLTAAPKPAWPIWGASSPSTKPDEQGHPSATMNRPPTFPVLVQSKSFGPSLRQTLSAAGLALAMQVVLLIDGRAVLANMGRLCFPTATQIVDFYHAMEHAGKVLVTLLGSKEHPDYKTRLGRWAKRLLNDKIEQLIAQTRKECAGKPHAEAVEKELGFTSSAISRVCSTALFVARAFHRLGSDRSGLQNRHWGPVQAIRHVLG